MSNVINNKSLTKDQFIVALGDVIECIKRKELYTDVRRKRQMIKWIYVMITRIADGEMYDDEDTLTTTQLVELTDYIAAQVKLPRRKREIC